MSMRRGMVLLALPLVVAACAGVVIIDQPIFNPNYIVDDFDYASRHGEIRTRIGDDPFGGPRGEFSDRVTTLMYGANIGGDVVFAATPKGAGSGRHHVVMLFNPPIGADEADFCAPDASFPTLPPSDTLRLTGAFCYKDILLSTAAGRVSNARSPSDNLFRDLVRQVTLALFPGYDDLDVGDSGGNNTD